MKLREGERENRGVNRSEDESRNDQNSRPRCRPMMGGENSTSPLTFADQIMLRLDGVISDEQSIGID